MTTHGVRGELKLYPWCDSAETLKPVKTLYLDPQGTQARAVLSVRAAKKMNIIKLEGCDSVEQARAYLDRVLYVDRSELRLPPGRYFVCDLIGLAVLDAGSGARLGEVCDVTNNGAQDLYHVRLPGGGVRMVPAVPAFIRQVDLARGEIRIQPIRGMLDDAD